MRLRSVSNRGRSKYAFLPQGSLDLTRVARPDLRRSWSTDLAPLILRLRTLVGSWAAPRGAESAETKKRATKTRIPRIWNQDVCRIWRVSPRRKTEPGK